MTVFFAGGELEAFTSWDATSIEVTNIGATIPMDSTYARCAIRTGNSNISAYIETPDYTSATTSWTHFEFNPHILAGGISTHTSWYNDVGTEVFRILRSPTGGQFWQCQYWSGSVWTNIGSTLNLTSFVTINVDVKIACGASGSFELYRDGVLMLSGSATMTAVTNIARVRFWCSQTTNLYGGYISQVICTDVPTVGWKLYTKPPTGNGANTAFTNDYTAVDELALNNADYIESTVANDIETFTGAALTLTSGVVKGVVVSAKALTVAGAPANLQLAVRRGATDYFSASNALTVGFAPYINIWETDPSTAADWVRADAAAAATEFGVKSIT
jgi:hypothetical protein